MKRKKKIKRDAYTRKRINRQRARFDAYVDAFAAASFDEIMEALLRRSDMKEKMRKRNKKNKRDAYTRKRINRQRARFEACVDAHIDALVEASSNQIIEALLLSPDGRTSLSCYIPGC